MSLSGKWKIEAGSLNDDLLQRLTRLALIGAVLGIAMLLASEIIPPAGGVYSFARNALGVISLLIIIPSILLLYGLKGESPPLPEENEEPSKDSLR